MNILGLRYKVYEVYTPNDGDTDCDGFIDFESREITIDANATFTNKMQIAIHEGAHGLFDRLGLGCNIDPMLEEIIVDTFGKFIVENFELKPKWNLNKR